MDENREYQIFENYTESVCRKIMSQRKKNEVRDELYSHLLEEYERNSALGMDDETAQTAAIEKMGDENQIANNFGALYSVIPTEYMRSSLSLIIWGMVLSFFQINLFTGMSQITTFIGKILLLFGLVKLKGTHKKFKKAFYVNIGLELCYLVMQNISLYIVNTNDLQLINSFVFVPLNALVYWWIFSGANSLCKNLISDNDKKPHLTAGFIAYTTTACIIVFAALTEETIFAIITPILMIFSLCQLGRAKNILAYKEPEFDLKKTLKKSEKVILWILVFTLAITPIISMVVAASPKTEAHIHYTADINISESKINVARNNMLKLGFPEEYLKDLPDSEVLKYADATYLQSEGKEYITKTTLLNEKTIIAAVESFNFYLPNAEIRILMRLELPDDSKAKYRNGLYLQFYHEYFVPIESGDDNVDLGKFFLALSEKDNQIFSNDYISEYTPNQNPIEKFYIAGYEFNFVPESTNRRAYLAHSAIISKPTIMQVLAIDSVFFWQEIPISAEPVSINDMAINEFDGVFSFGGNSIESVRRRDLYNSFEYDYSYSIQDEMIDFDK